MIRDSQFSIQLRAWTEEGACSYHHRMPQEHKSGGCHCGAVRYEVDIDLSQPVVTCNCSICSKSGTMLAFVPAANFTLVKGEDAVRDYRFNKKNIAHFFCTTCGIRSFARGETPEGQTVAVNVRCLDDVDLHSFETMAYDGKSV